MLAADTLGPESGFTSSVTMGKLLTYSDPHLPPL